MIFKKCFYYFIIFFLGTDDEQSNEIGTDTEEEKDSSSEISGETNGEKSGSISDEERAKLVQQQNKITSDLIFGVERQISKMYQDKDPNKELKEAQRRFDDVTSKLADTTWGLTGTKKSKILGSKRHSQFIGDDLTKGTWQLSKKNEIHDGSPSEGSAVKRSVQGSEPIIKDQIKKMLDGNGHDNSDNEVDGIDRSFGENFEDVPSPVTTSTLKQQSSDWSSEPNGSTTTANALKKTEVEDDDEEGESDEGDF